MFENISKLKNDTPQPDTFLPDMPACAAHLAAKMSLGSTVIGFNAKDSNIKGNNYIYI